MDQPNPGFPPHNPAYPNYPAGPGGPGGPYPGPDQAAFQGYPQQPHGWQNAPQAGPMYGEGPKNTGKYNSL